MRRRILAVWLLIFAATAYADKVPLQNFGDPNAAAFLGQLRALESGSAREQVRIMQLGDSHTAGDYFTGQLRNRLQTRFGNAGMGWLTPGYVINQRSDQALLRTAGSWQMSNSKTPSNNGLFPLGGLFNQASADSTLEIAAKQVPAEGLWRVSVWLRTAQTPWQLWLPSGEQRILASTGDSPGEWNLVSAVIDAGNVSGLKLLAPPGGALGGMALDRLSPGVTLDAIGINGAKASVISRWDPQTLREQMSWRKPGLIILAYGTNEAFDNQFSADVFEREYRQVVRQLRQSAPSAALLIVGAPSSAKKKAPYVDAGCRIGVAPGLLPVMRIQRRIAQEEHTLYWDWAAFMGGQCGAAFWSKTNPPLIRADLVHMSAEGYTSSADALFEAIVSSIRR